jgi:hypothetical protein
MTLALVDSTLIISSAGTRDEPGASTFWRTYDFGRQGFG